MNKWSKIRIIKSGNVTEVYQYEKPYQYDNVGVPGSVIKTPAMTRRVDHLGRAQANIRRRIWSNVTKDTRPYFYTFTFKDVNEELRDCNKEWVRFSRSLRFLIIGIFYIRYNCFLVDVHLSRGKREYYMLFLFFF